jgi:SAM-dependent methyltransferase
VALWELERFIAMLDHVFRNAQRKLWKWRLARRLERNPGYSFTSDYTSYNTSNWVRIFEEYRGQAGIRMLEIGSYEGRSAVWFLENILTHPSASIVCLDFFTSLPLNMRFDHNIRRSGQGNKVTKLKGRSDAILSTLPLDHFDIIYIDGSHQAADVLMDAMLSWYRIKPGGIMLLDDYLWAPGTPATERPQMAIDLFLQSFAGRYELLLKSYQIAIRKLPPARAQ